MKRLHKNELGFSVVEVLIIVLVVAVIGFGGYYVYSHNKKSTTNSGTPSTTTTTPAQTSQEPQLKTYKIENEGLTFSYNPKTTTISTQKTDTQNDLYVEYVKAKTGAVTLSITAGVSGIGGGPACEVGNYGRDKCEVIGTLKSTFLSKPITYRLVKGTQVGNCGYDGVPSCDVVPLETSYFLDTQKSTTTFGPCCGTISADARNTGKKAKIVGSLLVTVILDKQVQNKNLLTNKDFLDTIKIIESLHY